MPFVSAPLEEIYFTQCDVSLNVRSSLDRPRGDVWRIKRHVSHVTAASIDVTLSLTESDDPFRCVTNATLTVTWMLNITGRKLVSIILFVVSVAVDFKSIWRRTQISN